MKHFHLFIPVRYLWFIFLQGTHDVQSAADRRQIRDWRRTVCVDGCCRESRRRRPVAAWRPRPACRRTPSPRRPLRGIFCRQAIGKCAAEVLRRVVAYLGLASRYLYGCEQIESTIARHRMLMSLSSTGSVSSPVGWFSSSKVPTPKSALMNLGETCVPIHITTCIPSSTRYIPVLHHSANRFGAVPSKTKELASGLTVLSCPSTAEASEASYTARPRLACRTPSAQPARANRTAAGTSGCRSSMPACS